MCLDRETIRTHGLRRATSQERKVQHETRIAVIGAGLGGLTLAAHLQRAGRSVTVYEQADAFSRIGAGIIISANVIKALRSLGLEQRLVQTGIKPDTFVSRAWDTGETLYEIAFDAASEERFGAPYLNIHRGDLHRILEGAVTPGTIRFGHALASIEDDDGGARLKFTNGASASAEIVVGADGIRSQVREHVLGRDEPRFVGRVALRAIFPTARLGSFRMRDCTKWWALDRHVLAYFLTRARDEVYVIATVPAPGWDNDASFQPSSRDALLDAFAGCHRDLRVVLEAATDVTVWPIYDRPRDDRWSRGRAVLVGDACHPVRPYMAAGGAMAIEDGIILGRCITDCLDVADAFTTYAATRQDRVGLVQRISFDNSWMHGPTDVGWFFAYDPTTSPLTRIAT